MSEKKDPPAEHFIPPPGFAPCTRGWPHDGPCAHPLARDASVDATRDWIEDEITRRVPDSTDIPVGQMRVRIMGLCHDLHDRLRADLAAEKKLNGDLIAQQAVNAAIFDDKIGEVEKRLDAANEEVARWKAEAERNKRFFDVNTRAGIDGIEAKQAAHAATTAKLGHAVAEIQRALDANDIVCTTSCNEVIGHTASCSKGRMRAILADAAGDPAPIPMRLPCPGIVERNGMQVPCGELHVDEGEFATKPHHTHACQECGLVWRPAVVATVGVRFLPGYKNGGDS
jgi:hypothetical protein